MCVCVCVCVCIHTYIGLGNLNGDAGGNSILLVTVTNVVYPVNVDCLYKVFELFSKVLSS
jgi:hypothetical protein